MKKRVIPLEVTLFFIICSVLQADFDSQLYDYDRKETSIITAIGTIMIK